MKNDPCAAASLLARDVRADYKMSVPSLSDLMAIQDPCALLELIHLMDMPDGRNGMDVRKYVADEVRKRAPNGPFYDPHASHEQRATQMADWERWYHERFATPLNASQPFVEERGPSSAPATKTLAH
jgi:hypothetical protein